MKVIKLIFAPVLILTLVLGCKKEEEIIEEPHVLTGNNEFEEVWGVEKPSGYSFRTFVDIIQDKVIFISEGSYKTSLEARNKLTGEILWNKSYSGICKDTKSKGTTIVLNINDQLYAVNSIDGAIKWQYNLGFLHDYLIEGEYVFASFGNTYYKADSIYLYKINLSSGIQTHLKTIKSTDRGVEGQKVVSMSYWKHPNEDEILFLQSNEGTIGLPPCDFYAVNITTGNFYVNHINLGSSITPLLDHIVNDNYVYVNGGSYEFKYNLFTKEIENNESSGSSGNDSRRRMILYNGKLYKSIEEYDGILVKDANNLQKIKDMGRLEKNLGIEFDKGKNFKIVNNKLYNLTENCFSIFDLSTHELHKKLLYGQKWGKGIVDYFDYSFDIDSETNYIYLSWFDRVLCIKEK